MKGVEALVWNMFEYSGSMGLYLAYAALRERRANQGGRHEPDLDFFAMPREEDERLR